MKTMLDAITSTSFLFAEVASGAGGAVTSTLRRQPRASRSWLQPQRHHVAAAAHTTP